MCVFVPSKMAHILDRGYRLLVPGIVNIVASIVDKLCGKKKCETQQFNDISNKLQYVRRQRLNVKASIDIISTLVIYIAKVCLTLYNHINMKDINLDVFYGSVNVKVKHIQTSYVFE